MNPVLPVVFGSSIPSQPTSRPLLIRLISGGAAVGTLTAVVTIIYGIATNIFALIGIGAILLICTASIYYLIPEEMIREYTKIVQALNATIKKLEAQILATTQQLKTLEQQNVVLTKTNEDFQKKLENQMKQAEDQMAKAKAQAKELLEKTSLDENACLKKQLEENQKLIAQLQKTLSAKGAQIAQLEAAKNSLQSQATIDQQQIAEYTRLNENLSKQIQTIPSGGISSISPRSEATILSRADAINKEADQEGAELGHIERLMTQADATLNALIRNTPKK